MSLPDIELLSTRRISLPHLGHFVRVACAAGLRRYLNLIQEGNFIRESPDTDYRKRFNLNFRARRDRLAVKRLSVIAFVSIRIPARDSAPDMSSIEFNYSAACSSGATRGRMIWIRVPPPGSESRSSRPPRRLVTML